MVALYAILIVKGLRSFDSIDPNLKKEVKKELSNMGFDENGKPFNE